MARASGDIDAYRSQFDEPSGYLDFARFGPPSRAVLNATAGLSARAAHAGPTTVDDLGREATRAKATVARFCGTGAEHVALVPNTSLGLFHAAFGHPGEVLVAAGEFPANTYPWVRAEQVGRGRVRWLRPGSGRITPDAVAAALTPEVTALSVSAVDFRTGYRADLAALREVLGDRLLVVDAIQGFGAVDAPWEAADVLVAGGQKWMRAGWGTGFAVLSDRALRRLDPVLSGWTGAPEPAVFDDAVHPASGTAASWSLTNPRPVSAGALTAALELVHAAGVPAIEARIAERVGELEQAVHSCGGKVLSATGSRAGILAVTLPGVPAERVAAALAADGVTVTARGGQVRLSPHASTRPEAAEMVRACLRRLVVKRRPE
jgi:selenocysteine lyase/cysteine desulfurase